MCKMQPSNGIVQIPIEAVREWIEAKPIPPYRYVLSLMLWCIGSRSMTSSGVVQIRVIRRSRDQSISGKSHPFSGIIIIPLCEFPSCVLRLNPFDWIFIYTYLHSEQVIIPWEMHCVRSLLPSAHSHRPSSLAAMMYLQLLLDHIYCQYLHKAPFASARKRVFAQWRLVCICCRFCLWCDFWFVSLSQCISHTVKYGTSKKNIIRSARRVVVVVVCLEMLLCFLCFGLVYCHGNVARQ